MSVPATPIDDALAAAGTGPFQRRLVIIFGLVWAADAMQVLAIGFSAFALGVGRFAVLLVLAAAAAYAIGIGTRARPLAA